MRLKCAWLLMIWLLPPSVVTQGPDVESSKFIRMNDEPHHHLALHNSYINVFNVQVRAGDSIAVHRHDDDTIAIAIGDQTVMVGVPGKPDVHQKNADGQVRLQRAGYIHSTRVDGASPYHTVAVEFLHPQDNLRNLCAQVIAGLPLNCPEASPVTKPGSEVGQPQFESDQTRVQIVRVLAHRRVEIGHSARFELIVALDRGSLSPVPGQRLDQDLQPGDFVWFDKDGPSRTFKNNGYKEARYIEISLRPID
jgi:uncharacterized Zn-binding protein involved in type VI secretion